MRKLILSTLLALVMSSAYANDCCYEMPDNFNVNAQFLWWKAECENYSVIARYYDTAATPTEEVRSHIPFSFGWDPGFKLGVDYQTCVCGRNIDFFAEWTRFRSTDSHGRIFTIPTPPQAGIFSLQTVSGLTFVSPVASAINYNGLADFLYNRLDFGCVSESYCLANFLVNPSVALTYVHTRFAFTDTIDQTVTLASVSRSTNTYFNGVGVTLGADMTCGFLNCFSLYSKALLTGLWGSYTASIDGTTAAGGNPLLISSVIDERYSLWRGRWIADFEIGLEYNMYICGQFPLFARIGWEFQYMPNMNLMRELGSSLVSSGPSDVTINGLVLGFKVGF